LEAKKSDSRFGLVFDPKNSLASEKREKMMGFWNFFRNLQHQGKKKTLWFQGKKEFSFSSEKNPL
jgi:hypothetical protein